MIIPHHKIKGAVKLEGELTPDDLRILFHYDEDTGNLFWKVNTGRKRLAGNLAGVIRSDWYGRIGIQGKDYYIHRLVWAIVHGKWPDKYIDHINGRPNDNRIVNLREATQSQNIANSKVRKNSLTGIKGISIRRGQYVVHIMVNYKTIYLGDFKSLEEAKSAYNQAAEKYFGEFRRAV